MYARASRRGFSIVEIAIVVAVIAILAAVGFGMIGDLIPSWRTRRAAMDFAAAANTARLRAISEGVQYRILLSSYDSDIDSNTDNTGVYYVQRGDDSMTSSSWDTLPVDLSGTDSTTGEGTVTISKGGEDELIGVSIEQWDALTGVNGVADTIVFSPRGWLDNPVSDFGCDLDGDGSSDGYVCVTFVNKPARLDGNTDEWTVAISRGGFARLKSSRKDAVGNAAGTAVTSSEGGASGYSP